MRALLIKLFWPILRFFESDKEPENFKSSYRVILIVVGSLFWFLAAASGGSALFNGEIGALVPVIVFFAVGLVAIVVGALGSDSAVAKIWGMM